MKYQKIDVALSQLDSAIQAHNEKRNIEAITLAGASEEILGALCKRQGIQTSIEKISSLPIMRRHNKPYDVLNAPRNCLKHANNPSEDSFEVAEEDDWLMIVRAIQNLISLHLTQSPLVVAFIKKYSST